VQGAKKISYQQFREALKLIAAAKGWSVPERTAAMLAAGGPCLTDITVPDNVRFHDGVGVGDC